jgi:hypothetical protein
MELGRGRSVLCRELNSARSSSRKAREIVLCLSLVGHSSRSSRSDW